MANIKQFLGSGPIKPDLPHDKKDWSFTNNLSCKIGPIYPVFLAEMNPNEFFSCRPSVQFDLMPTIFPIQSNINMHLSFFGCAFRNLWKGWRDKESRVGNRRFPYIARTYNFLQTGSLMDYMGIPSYSNRPAIEWQVNPLLKSNDDDTNRYRRCFVNTDQNYGNPRNSDLPVAVGYGMSQFFSYQSNRSFDTPCQIQFPLRLPICVSQPYFSFKVYSISDSIPSSFTNIQLSFLSSALLSDPIAYDGANTTDRLFYFSRPISLVRVSDTSDFSSLTDNQFTLVSSKQVTFSSRTSCFEHTFYCRLEPTFVSFFNKLINDGADTRFVLMWNPLFNSYLGYNDAPFISIHSFSFNSLEPFSQLSPSQNSQYYTLSTARHLYLGLQGELLVRLESSINDNPTSSPFVIQTGEISPKLPLSALPPRMYQFIYNLYFRNSQIDPFIKNGQPTYNEYLTYDGDGADSQTPLDFNYALYEPDLFTTCKYTPQAGSAPLVGISSMPGAGDAVFHFENTSTGERFDLKVTKDDSDVITGISEYGTNANESTLKNLNALIQFGISINDFRSVSAFQRYEERHQRAGFDYKSIEKEFFGVNVPIGEEFPFYMGGISQPVSLFKIENQTAGDYPLGYFAGTGRVDASLGKDEDSITCRSSERMLVMGLLWFSVTPIYGQKLDKMWVKSDILDFYNPQFATIGNQPVHNYEIAPLQAQNDDELFGVFGYNRPWYEYVMKTDECHGQFRDTMHNYLLQREFATVPQLGKDFISVRPEDLTNIFSYSDGSDKIFGAIRFNAYCNSIVPDFVQPKIVG